MKVHHVYHRDVLQHQVDWRSMGLFRGPIMKTLNLQVLTPFSRTGVHTAVRTAKSRHWTNPGFTSDTPHGNVAFGLDLTYKGQIQRVCLMSEHRSPLPSRVAANDFGNFGMMGRGGDIINRLFVCVWVSVWSLPVARPVRAGSGAALCAG